MKTFPHGVHPKGYKELTENIPVTELPAPDVVYVPLQQHLGKEAIPVVTKCDRVLVGQKIGDADGAISAPVFSSVSGEVTGIERRATATGRCNHVVIKNDGKFDEVKLEPLHNPSPEEIVHRIAECGIVGMGGAGFPTAVKLKPRESIDTFIINAAECEPYLTCDYRILLERSSEFLSGAHFMARALGLSKFYIVVENNKLEAVKALESAIEADKIPAEVVLCQTKYPQGAEKQLIYAVTGRKVRLGKLPSSVGVIVDNAQTALSVHYAVTEGIKSYARVLTVSGLGVNARGNFKVRTGTPYSFILDYCGGKTDNAVKMISGGPMMGFAVSDDRIAVGKTTSGILLLTSEETNLNEATSCINCAGCVRACPMNLMPVYIDSYILSGDVAGAEKYGAMNCIECGSCAYVCPASRPLVQSIRLAKKKIRERGRK